MAHRWITPIFASVVLQLATFGAAAQSYPEKPIRLVVPYGVGGSSDIVGRILAQRIEQVHAATNALDEVMFKNVPPAKALADAEERVNEALETYNG